NGEKIPTYNLIWSAGVVANKINGLDKAEIMRGGRFKVNRFNKINGYDSIFAVGDIAYMETEKYPNGHPQVANVAKNQGKLLAKNFLKNDTFDNWTAYEYKDLGSMATIGKNKAVVDLPRWKFSGTFAWLTWMFVHLMLILTVKNRLIILINWATSYFSSDSSLRSIIKHKPKEQVFGKTV
ncbi:MAG TPA: FAD-dependent oxidoreductase, partial [Crocinitomicaceae bacterium]|nr:FAD-dependent oxidoreductase [Crocinitomicaceae bacterium]